MFEGQCRFFSEAGGYGEFLGIAFAAGAQVGLGPPQAGEFFGNNSFGLGLSAFNAEGAGMVIAEFAFDAFEHLFAEFFAAKAPAAAKGLERFFVGFGAAAGFHLAFELGAARGGVCSNAVFAKEAVDAHPSGTVFARGGIPGKAGPGIGTEAIFGLEQASAEGVEVDVIANGFEIAAAGFN